MIHTSRQDTKITLGQLAPQMQAAERAYMADDASLVNALLIELPGNAALQMWANNLQRKRAEARRVAWVNSIQELGGSAR